MESIKAQGAERSRRRPATLEAGRRWSRAFKRAQKMISYLDAQSPADMCMHVMRMLSEVEDI